MEIAGATGCENLIDVSSAYKKEDASQETSSFLFRRMPVRLVQSFQQRFIHHLVVPVLGFFRRI